MTPSRIHLLFFSLGVFCFSRDKRPELSTGHVTVDPFGSRRLNYVAESFLFSSNVDHFRSHRRHLSLLRFDYVKGRERERERVGTARQELKHHEE